MEAQKVKYQGMPAWCELRVESAIAWDWRKARWCAKGLKLRGVGLHGRSFGALGARVVSSAIRFVADVPYNDSWGGGRRDG